MRLSEYILNLITSSLPYCDPVTSHMGGFSSYKHIPHSHPHPVSHLSVMEAERIFYRQIMSPTCLVLSKISYLMIKFKILMMASKVLKTCHFPTSAIVSSRNPLLSHSFPVTLASLLFLKHINHALTLGALGLLGSSSLRSSHSTRPSFTPAFPCSRRFPKPPFIK